MHNARLTHRILPALAAAALASLLVLTLTASRSAGRTVAHADAHAAAACPGQSAPRDPANPLALATAPGANPLAGAQFMVPGPYSGAAAGAIAKLLGIDPKSLSSAESWAAFETDLQSGPLHAKLAGDPTLAAQVDELALVASQPEVQRISIYSWGGTPAGIYKQTHKDFCQIAATDPGTVPILSTYFLHPKLGGCATTAQIEAYMPRFHALVHAMARATGDRPAVFLLELDALGSSSCMARHGSLPAWEAALRYEMKAVASLPHTVVYVEGGYADSNSVRYTVRALKALDVGTIRGFFTNDTHEDWTSNEVRWANAIAARTGAHYIVDTADNGRGPLLNRHPTTEGVEDLCNPPGRGLGIQDTTGTGVPYADAYLWTHPPGNSSGSCNGGPPPGQFWPARAEAEATRANAQLGPGYPSEPYAVPALG